MMKATIPGRLESLLYKENLSLDDFALLISPEAGELLPQLAARAREITIQRFGKVIQFYAPVYLSNFCENHCLYCGFNRENSIPRVTLSLEEVERELLAVKKIGMDNILLLTGESPRAAGVEYIAQCVELAAKHFDFVGLEIYPMEVEEYARLVEAGAHGLTVYQETYNQEQYRYFHPRGRKRDYHRRLETPVRAFRGGMRKVGLGFLLGLADWREEAMRLAEHADNLRKTYWKGELTLSFPRIQPCNASFSVPAPVSDRDFIHLISALRIFFPEAGFVLSTREAPLMRDRLIELCITQMSAGSRTNPGGYSVENDSEEQFSIADGRELEMMMAVVSAKGYEPVLKDWHPGFRG